MPQFEEPDTEAVAGIDAAWIAQHAERVGMMLSLPDNDVEFTIEEVQTAVKTTLMDLGVVDPGKIDVASRGRTGPYEVTLSLAEREAVLSTSPRRPDRVGGRKSTFAKRLLTTVLEGPIGREHLQDAYRALGCPCNAYRPHECRCEDTRRP